MSVAPHDLVMVTFLPKLRMLSQILDKATEHAAAKGFDPSVFVGARLYPDMFTLAQQVYMACFYAEDAVARLTGAEPQKVTKTEDETIEDLKARIAKTIGVIEKASSKSFEGAAERDIAMPLFANLVLEMKGADYLMRWSMAHFYFHVVTAYDLLRHNGVEIGKRDFVDVGAFVHQA